MTPIDFAFFKLPDSERELALVLRGIVRDTLPHVQERLAYNAPFYYGKRRICFIWPASIPWGGIDRGVALGFCYGRDLPSASALEFADRKEVGQLRFHTPDEIDPHLVTRLLAEAHRLDQSFS